MSAKLELHPVDARVPHRKVSSSDHTALAELMLEAYRGGVDDDGETLEDAMKSIAATLGGDHGVVIGDACFAALELDKITGATLVTLFHGEPLLAQVFTAPDRRRRRVASDLIRLSMNQSARAGYSTMNLVVTEGNTAAEELYSTLGFRRVPDLW